MSIFSTSRNVLTISLILSFSLSLSLSLSYCLSSTINLPILFLLFYMYFIFFSDLHILCHIIAKYYYYYFVHYYCQKWNTLFHFSMSINNTTQDTLPINKNKFKLKFKFVNKFSIVISQNHIHSIHFDHYFIKIMVIGNVFIHSDLFSKNEDFNEFSIKYLTSTKYLFRLKNY